MEKLKIALEDMISDMSFSGLVNLNTDIIEKIQNILVLMKELNMQHGYDIMNALLEN